MHSIPDARVPAVHRNGSLPASLTHAVIPQPARATRGRTALDLLLAVALLTITVPVFALAVILVKLTSRGPVLYRQLRLGRHGQPFQLYKIRTMVHECESLTGPCWSTPGDPRVTWVGRWLRRLHVDELPQLWNVVRGDMSLIGPRPERPEFVPALEKVMPHYRTRLDVPPGLTGLAQVQLPPDTDLESVRLKLAYDLYYLRQASWWLHVRIHLATVLHLAGVPFPRITRVLRFPPRAAIERAYQALDDPPPPPANGSINGNGHANGSDLMPRLDPLGQ